MVVRIQHDKPIVEAARARSLIFPSYFPRCQVSRPSKEIDRHVMGKAAGLYAIHPVGIFKHRLITQRPTSIAVAFQTSQEYKTLGEMEAHLNLTSIGLRHDLLREAAVSYDLDIWDE